MTSPASEDQIDAKVARYQIGEVADRTSVTQRTLRFYEEKGLLRPPERMDGGFRLYSDADVERIEYIRRLQQYLGFTLAEIKEMVEAEDLRQQIIATFRPDRELPARLERVTRIIGALERQLEVVDHKAAAARRLAAFQGSFDLAAAREVANADASTLSRWFDRALVRREALDRYALHPLVRHGAPPRTRSRDRAGAGGQVAAPAPVDRQDAPDQHTARHGRFAQIRHTSARPSSTLDATTVPVAPGRLTHPQIA